MPSDWLDSRRGGSYKPSRIRTVITYHAAKTILGAQSSSENSEQTVTAVLLQQPLGASLIAAAGLGFAIYGIIELVKATRNSFMDPFKLNEILRAMYRYLVVTAKFGLFARVVVFGLIGYFLVRTAVFSDPEETKGLDDALASLHCSRTAAGCSAQRRSGS
ncbi:DUF1206 domain-containing protein [Cohnella sp. OV330]|uniref:DUF1206 domain-containing protein n=1 Tax=Cohnella sp. OV330 TaxID=1855288 RepID=UPI000B7D0C91|nr:DUF1206 domain-containing protein [Cohnella sp. OV330]